MVCYITVRAPNCSFFVVVFTLKLKDPHFNFVDKNWPAPACPFPQSHQRHFQNGISQTCLLTMPIFARICILLKNSSWGSGGFAKDALMGGGKFRQRFRRHVNKVSDAQNSTAWDCRMVSAILLPRVLGLGTAFANFSLTDFISEARQTVTRDVVWDRRR